jgi:hypothetical protein
MRPFTQLTQPPCFHEQHFGLGEHQVVRAYLLLSFLGCWLDHQNQQGENTDTQQHQADEFGLPKVHRAQCAADDERCFQKQDTIVPARSEWRARRR